MIKTKTSSFLDPDFSIEDISTGFYTDINKNDNVARSIIFDLGIEEFAQCVTDRDNEDDSSYAIEAVNNYNDAVLFGNYANMAFEHLQSEPVFLGRIKEAFSIENLDPYNFSLEADDKGKGPTPKVKIAKANIFKRIFSAIAMAFKKLIMMIGNFIRSVMNAIKGGMLKSAAKFYENNKAQLPALLKKYGDTTFKGVIPVKTPNYNKIDTTKINSLTDTLCSHQEEVERVLEKIKSMKAHGAPGNGNLVKGIGTFFSNTTKALFSGSHKLENVFNNASKDLTDILSLGVPEAKTFLAKKGAMTSMGAPSKVASIIIFGTEKPVVKNVKYSEFIKAFPFENLSQKSMDDMKKIIKEGEKGAKSLQKAYKQIQASAKAVEEAIATSVAPQYYNGLKKGCNALTSLGNATRMLNVYMCGVLLNVHKEHLRCVSYLSTIARGLVKKGGSGVGGGKKEKKFDTKTGKHLKK